MRAALLAAALLFVAAGARADAMPSCPPGQHLVHNPVAPGSGHHGGGHCEGGCSIAVVGHGGSVVPLAAFVLALAVLGARRK